MLHLSILKLFSGALKYYFVTSLINNLLIEKEVFFQSFSYFTSDYYVYFFYITFLIGYCLY